MNALATLYPPLPSRTPYPPLYQPLTLTLTLLPFLTPHRRPLALFLLPLLLTLCLRAPFYTFGDPSADYYNTSMFFALPLWFLEFAILRPVEGDGAPVYVGDPGSTGGKVQKWGDLKSVWERLWWAGGLMVPSHRGVGWNWRVKHVPEDPDVGATKWRYVGRQVWRVVKAYLWSVCMLVVLGWASALEKSVESKEVLRRFLVDAVIGWAGAFWVLNRLQCFYSACAAVSVAVGVCETWQWPPLVGSLRDASSVGRLWGVAYHQTMRMVSMDIVDGVCSNVVQIVSQPALRITRFLGVRKGSMASCLLQLYISFGISCLLHQFEIFNLTRKDMGEFAFFMSQAVAISFEIIAQPIWRNVTKEKNYTNFLNLVGYIWVTMWMSLTLPWYVKGFRDAGIAKDAIFGETPMEIGALLNQKANTHFGL